MPSKAKVIAISGICGAVATLSLLCCGLPATKWAIVLFAVVCSVAVSIPTMVSGNVVYSILTYLVSGTVGVIFGMANIVYVASIVTFAMPMAIVKVNAETLKVSTKTEQKVIDDPFGNGDDKQVLAVDISATPKMKPITKWILYYVIFEIGLALTLGCSYLFARTFFQTMVEHKLFVVALIVLQAFPIIYDFVLRGCFNATAKAIKRYMRHD